MSYCARCFRSAITENVTVTSQAPLIETSNASTGTVLDTEALQTLPAPGRAAFLVGVSIPTVIQSGDGQFNRQQDQTNASLSVLKDNQIGETNFYSNNGNDVPVNSFNYIASKPACQAGQQFTTACYDPMAEYQTGILDVPHRIIVAPIWQLPSPADKSGFASWLAANWTAAAVFNFQSGFPIGLAESDNTLFSGATRPNLVAGVDLATSGDLAARLASADHSTATWLNPAAVTAVPAGTFGNAPRLETDARTPRIINTDLSVSKSFSLSGGKSAQLKFEVINLFNRVQTNTVGITAGSSTFGQISSQSGFMRLSQIIFRFTF